MLRRIALLTAVPSLVGLAFIHSPAQADATGDFGSQTYYSNLYYDTQLIIENRCDCTGAEAQLDSDDKDVIYKADNATFAWNIVEITIHYHKEPDNTWHSVNASSTHQSNWFDSGKGKGRTTAGDNFYQDNINYVP